MDLEPALLQNPVGKTKTDTETRKVGITMFVGMKGTVNKDSSGGTIKKGVRAPLGIRKARLLLDGKTKDLQKHLSLVQILVIMLKDVKQTVNGTTRKRNKCWTCQRNPLVY
jgi:hypothetical protein